MNFIISETIALANHKVNKSKVKTVQNLYWSKKFYEIYQKIIIKMQ